MRSARTRSAPACRACIRMAPASLSMEKPRCRNCCASRKDDASERTTMLVILSVIVVVIVAGSQYRNGIFTSATMLIQVLLAGVVAFGLWEPLADELDPLVQEGRMAGYEDCIALTALFAGTLLVLRLTTNRINQELFDFNPIAQQFCGPAIGVVTGYLVSGFLICVLQTLPLDEEF